MLGRDLPTTAERDSLLTGEGGRGVVGAKSYDGVKAWSSINHSILTGKTQTKVAERSFQSEAPPRKNRPTQKLGRRKIHYHF
jgi:hypothetical protein